MVVKWLTQRRKKAELRRLGRAPGDDLWEKARAAFEGGLLFASSQGEAKAFASKLPTASRSKQEESDGAISSSIKQRGVAVGALPASWRSRNFEDLGPEQQDGANRLLASLENQPIESRLEQSSVVPHRSVQFGEHNYVKGDFVVVGGRDAEEFGQVKQLYSASGSEGERCVFADLAFFRVKVFGRRAERTRPAQLPAVDRPGGSRKRQGSPCIALSAPFHPAPPTWKDGAQLHGERCH
jgi:hypothetical protein